MMCKFIAWFKRVFITHEGDPVYHCEHYKQHGCAHVDGYLCDMETCFDEPVYGAKVVEEKE